VKIGISWVNPANDFDLHVFDSNGAQIASSAGGAPGNTEQVTIPAVAGTYSVKVLFYTVAADNYKGTATLVSGPSARTATYVSGGITFSPNVTVKAPAAGFVHDQYRCQLFSLGQADPRQHPATREVTE